jgi:hypothetical protein
MINKQKLVEKLQARYNSRAKTVKGLRNARAKNFKPVIQANIFRRWDRNDSAKQLYLQKKHSVKKAYSKINLQWPYNTPNGGYSLSVNVSDKPGVEAYSDTMTPSGKSYRERMHIITLSLHKSVFMYPEIACIGGLVTVYAEKFAPRCYRASWVVGGYRARYGIERGYIIKGYHVTEDQLLAVTGETGKRALAVRIVNEKRKQTIAVTLHRRAVLQKQRRENKDYREKARNAWVTFESSLKAGNCQTGTQQMKNIVQRRLHADGDIGAIRGDILLSMRDDYYVRRAISAAMAGVH